MDDSLRNLIEKIIWAVLCAIVSYCVAKIKNYKQKIKTKDNDMLLVKDAVRHTLCGILVVNHAEYISRGWCSHLEKEEFLNAYQTYHELGGNGVITHIKEEVLSLPDEEV